MKVASCSIIILENLYLTEFIEWQKSKGFCHVFIYDHNTKENPLDVLQPYVDEGFVTVIPWQGHQIGPAVMEAFQDCWDKYRKNYDWIQFCDIDEYIDFTLASNINDYLSEFKSADIIKINWLCYDDNDLIYYDDRPQMERFIRPCGPNHNPYLFNENKHIKSIINTKAKYINFINGSPHCPNRFYGNNNQRGIFRYDLTIVDNTGKILTFNEQRNESKISYINYEKAYLRHFRCKTIEEYCKNKITKLPFDQYKKIDFNLNLFCLYNKSSEKKSEYYQNFIESLNEKNKKL